MATLPRTHSARRAALEGYIFLLPWIIGFLAFQFGSLLASLYFFFLAQRLFIQGVVITGVKG